jgi:hypothetical protein
MVDTAVGVLKYLALGAQLVLRDQKVALIDLAHVTKFTAVFRLQNCRADWRRCFETIRTIINYADLEIHFSRLSECPNE